MSSLPDIYKPTPKQPVVEKVLLSSRYLLVPMYLGLIGAMICYNYAFMCELFHMATHLNTAENLKEFCLMGTLNLVDAAMVGNLIIMVMIGSHSIFVNEIDSTRKGMPRFIKGLTSGLLKVKLGSSLVSVSSVHLLAAFMNSGHESWEELSKKIALHVAFIISAFIFAMMEVKLHPPQANTQSH